MMPRTCEKGDNVDEKACCAAILVFSTVPAPRRAAVLIASHTHLLPWQQTHRDIFDLGDERPPTNPGVKIAAASAPCMDAAARMAVSWSQARACSGLVAASKRSLKHTCIVVKTCRRKRARALVPNRGTPPTCFSTLLCDPVLGFKWSTEHPEPMKPRQPSTLPA